MQKTATPQISKESGNRLLSDILTLGRNENLNSFVFPRTVAKLLLLHIILLFLLKVAWTSNSNLVVLSGLIALSFLMSQFAFIAHDVAHGAVSLISCAASRTARTILS